MLSKQGRWAAALAGIGALTLWGGYSRGQGSGIRGQRPPMVTATQTTIHNPQSTIGNPQSQSATSPGQVTIVDKAGKPAGICPLAHTDVKADIAGYMARVTVTQDFVNTSREPIEAVYTFPLPDDAAVDDMTMQIGERQIRGEIKKREEAREIYEAARSQGKTASLLDQERPNIFTQTVANILPGAKIRIHISYVNLLKYQEGVYEWAFPLVVGPRYTPAGGYTQAGQRGKPSPAQNLPEDLNDVGTQPLVTDADKITPPITPPNTRAGHDVSISVHLDAGLPLQNVKCVLHAVDVQPQGQTAADIRLQDRAAIPNKDFILRYTAAGSEIQEGLLTYAGAGNGQRGKGNEAPANAPGGYFTLIIQPPLAPPKTDISPKEMVFVIDQTGSQSGWSLEKAKETMRHCIQAMNPNDTFQLLAFNTENFPCFAAPVHNNPENVQKALEFLAPLQGNGGTDILKAADYALKIPDDPDRLRIVCYMTDGYVGNDMQIIDYIGKHRGRARMFPFGVGNSVNRFLIEGMAREGRGASEYVTLNEPGEGAAARFYKRIASPLLLDPQVDWGGLPVTDMLPKHIPDVFTAGPIIVKGRYTHPGEGDVTLHGLLRGKPWQRTLHVVFPAQSTGGSAIPTLWAREKIEDLKQQEWLGAQSGHSHPEIEKQIVATALEYRLMSQYTSFVAVEEKVVNAGGKQRRVDVPVELPEGMSVDGILGEAEKSEQVSRQLAFGVNVLSRGGRGASGNGASYGYVRRSRSDKKSSAQNRAATPLSAAKPAATPGFLGGVKAGDALAIDADNSLVLRYDALDSEEGRKELAQMKPEERRKVYEEIKLAASLRGLAAHLKKDGRNGNLDKPGLPKVENGRVEVQIWLNALPAAALASLKALGFDLLATLQPKKLLLGSIPVEKLNDLLELAFVRRVEPPKFK